MSVGKEAVLPGVGMPPGIVEMVRRLSIDGGDAVKEEEEGVWG